MSSLSGTVPVVVLHQRYLRMLPPSDCLEQDVHTRWDEAHLIRREDSLPSHPQTVIPLATVLKPNGRF